MKLKCGLTPVVAEASRRPLNPLSHATIRYSFLATKDDFTFIAKIGMVWIDAVGNIINASIQSIVAVPST